MYKYFIQIIQWRGLQYWMCVVISVDIWDWLIITYYIFIKTLTFFLHKHIFNLLKNISNDNFRPIIWKYKVILHLLMSFFKEIISENCKNRKQIKTNLQVWLPTILKNAQLWGDKSFRHFRSISTHSTVQSQYCRPLQ